VPAGRYACTQWAEMIAIEVNQFTRLYKDTFRLQTRFTATLYGTGPSEWQHWRRYTEKAYLQRITRLWYVRCGCLDMQEVREMRQLIVKHSQTGNTDVVWVSWLQRQPCSARQQCIVPSDSVVIHADHVVQSAWILFSLWMYVCLYVC